LIAATVVALVVSGCAKRDSTDTSEAPQIPPASTFVIDFGDFESSSSASFFLGNAGQCVDLLVYSPTEHSSLSPDRFVLIDSPNSSENWQFAALNVGVWNTIITIGLAIPVVSFLESFNHAPVRQPDGSWLWSYEVRVLGIRYTAELYGSLVGSEVHWEMYISKEGFYEDFNWYSGVCTLLVTEGTWTLLKSPEEPYPWIGIEWHRSLTGDTADIKYTNIVPDGPENGGYILYRITTGETYEAFYDIYNKGEDNLVEIEWNRTTKEGRVRNLKHFGDTDWHCWDSNLRDIECPQLFEITA
jgi:hypothetical protein